MWHASSKVAHTHGWVPLGVVEFAYLGVRDESSRERGGQKLQAKRRHPEPNQQPGARPGASWIDFSSGNGSQ
jgi:hypothetical protein